MLSAQSGLYLSFQDNSTREIDLTTFSKMTFGNGVVRFVYLNAVTDDYAVSTIKRIGFSPDESLNIDEKQFSKLIELYPNPTDRFLYFSNIVEATQMVNIYSLQGLMVYSGMVNHEQQVIDVSTLSSGVYLLKIGAQTLKFMKR
jgi:hypothetical protein